MTIESLIREVVNELDTTYAGIGLQDKTANNDETVITRVLPGIKREDITISVTDGKLSIKTKSNNPPLWAATYANNSWTYLLSPNALLSAVDAKHVDGVLTVRIPHIKQEKKQFNISVN